MRKHLITTLVLAAVVVSDAHAAQDWFPGQTGQYHLLPDSQDVQNITLIGQQNAACPSGVALFAVDEFGKADTVPFVVPSRTAFVLTDALFTGYTAAAYPGQTPILSIAQSSPSNTYHRASFLGPKLLQAISGEYFAGSGSLQTGAVFAVNEKLCAELSFNPSTYGYAGLSLTLVSVEVHGKVIDNSRTTSWPYISW